MHISVELRAVVAGSAGAQQPTSSNLPILPATLSSQPPHRGGSWLRVVPPKLRRRRNAHSTKHILWKQAYYTGAFSLIPASNSFKLCFFNAPLHQNERVSQRIFDEIFALFSDFVRFASHLPRESVNNGITYHEKLAPTWFFMFIL